MAIVLLATSKSWSQGIAFSQYYNTPLLINPANASLMPDHDYRVALNYRDQWSKLPVPFRTIGAAGDFQLFRNQFETNWMGIGFSFYNDRAGAGQLSLSKLETYLAYHVQAGEFSMFSFGFSGGYGARGVNMDRLTFNTQWDGLSFNPSMNSGEATGVIKSNYFDLGAGFNFSFYPNENVYIKLGASVAHLNRPKEHLIALDHRMSMRPTGHVEAIFKLSDFFMLEPSVFYTTQAKAQNLIAGTRMSFLLSDPETNNKLYLGGYYRNKESIIGVVGFGLSNMDILFSYDYTTSDMNRFNGKTGAIEVGFQIRGLYSEDGRGRSTYGCPRF